LCWRTDVRAADAARVAELIAATVFFNTEEIAIARELVEEHLNKGRASGYWFVFAETADGMAGYACFGPIPATVTSYHLYWIAVAPACQARGIGRALLGRVEAAIREGVGTRLYVETSSRLQYAPTREFYERTGFRQAALLPDYFAPGDGKIIYEKLVSLGG
jgi:ribosomal protein S18 acetylase RimI-like enzyme